jgi:hypothetical protein
MCELGIGTGAEDRLGIGPRVSETREFHQLQLAMLRALWASWRSRLIILIFADCSLKFSTTSAKRAGRLLVLTPQSPPVVRMEQAM